MDGGNREPEAGVKVIESCVKKSLRNGEQRQAICFKIKQENNPSGHVRHPGLAYYCGGSHRDPLTLPRPILSGEARGFTVTMRNKQIICKHCKLRDVMQKEETLIGFKDNQYP